VKQNGSRSRANDNFRFAQIKAIIEQYGNFDQFNKDTAK
jgi:hypothetical protein